MSLLALAVYDPPGEPRTALLNKCLWSIARTVKWADHRLFLIDNGAEEESRAFCERMCEDYGWTLLGDGTNRGTARAINLAWQQRRPGEHCLKIDSDVLIPELGWLEKLEECVARDPKIGIIGLKRRDLDEAPFHPPSDWRHSQLRMLPHRKGQTWLVTERVHHVMGSCCLYNSLLLDQIGYLYQSDFLYGYDDSLAAVRCEKAGFYSCFYPHYLILHDDPGTCDHTQWKLKRAGECMPKYRQLLNEFTTGKRPVYCGPDDP